MVVTVTEKAVKEVKHIAQEQGLDLDKVVLRARVLGGGCSGYQTKLDLDENFTPEKDNIEEIDGIKVAVDKRSSLYLQGATIDFHDALDKRGFVVTNPNARNTCGCGSSFSM